MNLFTPASVVRFGSLCLTLWLLAGCDDGRPVELAPATEPADLVLVQGRVYTLAWGDPDVEGRPAADAPLLDGVWQPDATALAIRDGKIVAVGDAAGINGFVGKDTRTLDLNGATVIPGLIESHGHYNELGEQAERVDVREAVSVDAMANLIAPRIAGTAPDEWLLGSGWDEGAWADALPTNGPLNAVAPEHPVVLKGRRGFGLLANARALEIAGISSETPSPSGGEVVKHPDGEPTGVLLNRAQALINDVIPEPTLALKKRRLLHGLDAIARAGYVTGHHAGVYGDYMPAYEALAEEGALPIRMQLMIAARPENKALMARWIERGPTRDLEQFLQVRGVKAYYDGSLGSRGARLLEDYSDQPGHRGVSGDAYGFPEDLVRAAMAAGFQVGVHAIGDAGNRAVLDFYEAVLADGADSGIRHRVEHAQIVHPEDFTRFGALGLVASMEPGHAVEDSPWAEDRVGPDRILGGYAWRSLRRAGAGLVFNSDLAGTDYDIFYGLHCAVTRSDRDANPIGGWYPEQAVTIEEAVRAYTVWPAWASGLEALTGTVEVGKWADLTVLSIDPFAAASDAPATLLDGEVLMTIVAGAPVFDARSNPP